MSHRYFYFCLVFLIITCEPYDLKQVNFLQLKLESPIPLSVNQIVLQGSINGLAVGQVEEFGLVWTSEDVLPTFSRRDDISQLGVMLPGDNPVFQDTISGLLPDTPYRIRAFAKSNEEIFYSNEVLFNSGKGSVETIEVSYESGNTIELTGQLNGTEAGIIATSHGFCWSTANSDPVLEPCCDCIDLGNRTNNTPFVFEFSGLEDGTPYFFQSFAVMLVNGVIDTVYGGALSFDGNLNDFWIYGSEEPAMARCDAVAFSIDGKAYIGTGWDGDQALNDFWAFDPETGIWASLEPVPGSARTKAVGFAIAGKGYIGMGWNGTSGTPFRDIYEYEPGSNTWQPMPDFPDNLGGRRNAVSFSIQDKGYVCTGFDGGFLYSSECWEFNPAGGPNNSWVKKASLGIGRVDATGFAIGGKGYVLTGENDPFSGVLLKDVWEFDPSIGLDGMWSQKEDFPGVARTDGVGFSIPGTDRGFMGTGWSGVIFQLNDFWEYQPSNDEWIRRADLPGPRLRNAIGFGINSTGNGFIGTGGARTVGQDCDSLQYQFWQYDSQ